jgi:hypothetical protein
MIPLIQTLPDGPLDIIGDIHGEYDALVALLKHLGYDENGNHSSNRTVIFVGDFVDRGHDSPAVLTLAQRWNSAGRAFAVLGNHEINLLRDDAKEGSGWWFNDRHKEDKEKFGAYHQADYPARENMKVLTRKEIHSFLSSLPIALERSDLRVIHAVWHSEFIAQIKNIAIGCVRQVFDLFEADIRSTPKGISLSERKAEEQIKHARALINRSSPPPFLHAHAEYEEYKQMGNPLSVLTSGIERQLHTPEQIFWAAGKWRFVERVAWWNEYDDQVPVVIGHYWRSSQRAEPVNGRNDTQDIFESIDPFSWHGKHNNVFCIDFSVGKRWSERRMGLGVNYSIKLAAFRWPERTIVFDDGIAEPSHSFMPGL